MSAPDTSVLLLGSGGREHALAWVLGQSPRLKNFYALPGSAAISDWAQSLPGDPSSPQDVVAAAKDRHAGLVIVGPEAPLAAGVADALRAEGILVFGPNRDGARLESSKIFAKEFMARHGIPAARSQAFADAASAKAALASWPEPVVVKADGLAGGKGVFVCASREEALQAVEFLMERRGAGAAGGRILLEEALSGPELSAMALCDGKSFRLLPLARDHKRLKDGDLGPNTGGMGAVAPVAISPAERGAVEDVFARAMKGLAAEGVDYRGVLYAGLMMTAHGPKVLEFNCRLGDPETQVVLPLLASDFLDLALACAKGDLGLKAIKVRPGSCVCVVMASAGYPQKPQPAGAISGLEEVARDSEVKAFHAATTVRDRAWSGGSGRVLSVCAGGKDAAAARQKAYAAADKIFFEGKILRRDIAAGVPAPTSQTSKGGSFGTSRTHAFRMFGTGV
ncbi:MAG TPA: phosphoribosylamine--glycine ligase [Elusimicrobiota bacterium]|nr:phosphoribosylamine--glycine ligase [Elusimicrobiota bacterium]